MTKQRTQDEITTANAIYKTAHNFIVQRGSTMGRRLSPLEAVNTNRIKFNFLKKLRQKKSSELGMYNTNLDHEVVDYLPSINNRAEQKV